MKVKKQYLETLFNFIKGTDEQLTLSESRKRDAFLKEIAPVLETFYADRKVIYEKFAVKDASGKPDIVNDKYSFEKEVIEELGKELTLLFEEEVEISNLPKDIVDKSEYKPKVGEVEIIDNLLATCEN